MLDITSYKFLVKDNKTLNAESTIGFFREYDFGPTFAADKISKKLVRTISKEKIRQMQIRKGLRALKKAKKKRIIAGRWVRA